MRCQHLLARYNETSAEQDVLREALLRELLGTCGTGVVVKPPFRCDYGQYIHIGDHTFINYDAMLLDVRTSGRGALPDRAASTDLDRHPPLGPGTAAMAGESGEPVTIGDNVWLGQAPIVLPGVSIGITPVGRRWRAVVGVSRQLRRGGQSVPVSSACI
ncbi:MAG: hypothetical protein IPG68_14690 [Micrococcales bacterium]|nr:hypothetical protein [Micrococcales bacterium]